MEQPPVAVGVAVASTSVPLGQQPAQAFAYPGQSSPPQPANPEALLQRGYPGGLISVLNKAVEAFPLRLWIVDNSGSMNSTDGTRLVSHGGKTMQISSTRWAELGETVNEAAEIATALNARTDFFLLNPPVGRGGGAQHYTIGSAVASAVPAGMPCDVAALKDVMGASPAGKTPLTAAVERVIGLLAPAADKLRAHGQQAVVVIATDGLPDDPGSFLVAVQSLQRLPVWLVVRLCTNEQAVVDYWSDIDKRLEASVEVLDDVSGESEEIAKVNPWLTYGPPLHSAREFGLSDKLFDLLDEQPLAPSQGKQFIELLLGCDTLTEPEISASEFAKGVKVALSGAQLTYDPRTRAMRPWVDVKKLSAWGKGGGGCVIT